MSPLVYATLSALANVAGALVVAGRARRSMRLLEALIAVAAGFMISVALTQLVPEALSRGGTSAPVVMLVGYLAVHFTQHTLTSHFHFGEETHSVTTAISVSALAGLLMHTFVDGVAIAAGFTVGRELGLLVFIAVVLHKLPEGLAIASLFLAAGQPPRVAVAAAGALGLTTLLGVLATDFVRPLADHGLPLAAGVTLYVAASNLVPEFQAKRGWSLALYFFGGCGLFTLAYMLLS
ncbi:MAG TPA: ZIP family metal transporter [Gemmatimonadaceae bacterium]|jgi:zinc and cadmium transporter|nr:ZIP family metal transporter [Gemmatimonadaceae bacterium]